MQLDQSLIKCIHRCLIDSPAEYPQAREIWEGLKKDKGFSLDFSIAEAKQGRGIVVSNSEGSFRCLKSDKNYKTLESLKHIIGGESPIKDVRMAQQYHWIVFIDVGKYKGMEENIIYNDTETLAFYSLYVPLSVTILWKITLKVEGLQYSTQPVSIDNTVDCWYLHKKCYYDSVNNPNDTMSAGTLLLLCSSNPQDPSIELSYSRHPELTEIMYSAKFQCFNSLSELEELLGIYVDELRKWWFETGCLEYIEHNYHFCIVIGLRFDEKTFTYLNPKSMLGSYLLAAEQMQPIKQLDVARVKPSGFHIVHMSVEYDVPTLYNSLLKKWAKEML